MCMCLVSLFRSRSNIPVAATSVAIFSVAIIIRDSMNCMCILLCDRKFNTFRIKMFEVIVWVEKAVRDCWSCSFNYDVLYALPLPLPLSLSMRSTPLRTPSLIVVDCNEQYDLWSWLETICNNESWELFYCFTFDFLVQLWSNKQQWWLP